MSDTQTPYQRYRALQEEFYASEGLRLYNVALSNRITIYIFEENFNELLRLIRLHFDLSVQHKLGDFHNREPLHQFLFEVTRQLYNFLASSQSLLEHASNCVKNSYGSNSMQFKEFVAEHDKYAATPIFRFTSDLRNFFIHVRTPFIVSVMGGSEAVGRERYTLWLSIEKMGLFERWSKPAKTYIDSYQQEIDLELYVLEYFECVAELRRWLDERTQEWSKSEWEKSLAMYDEVIAYRQARDQQSRHPAG